MDDTIARIFFTVDKSLMILLHGIIKKSQKTPKKEIDLARNRNNGIKECNMRTLTGSSFDDFLREENILSEVSAKAQKRLLYLQIKDLMQQSNLTKTKLATRLETSRSQLDRILDPDNIKITLEGLDCLADAIGKKLRIEFV